MRCFHCNTPTELHIHGRPICASAECHLVALEGHLRETSRIPPDMLAKVESRNIAAALAHQEYVANLYGKVVG